MEWLKKILVKWLLPSGWVETLNGKKRLIGVISLLVWALIYAVPAVCTLPVCGQIANFGLLAQQWLAAVGIPLDATLLGAGAALTVVGLVDYLLKHIVSEIAIAVFTWLEKKLSLGKLHAEPSTTD